MKKLYIILRFLVAALICVWLVQTAHTTNNYIIGIDRYQNSGFRKPKVIRDIESFFTLSDDPNPYTALDDLLATDISSSRVAFLLGSPSEDKAESSHFYTELTGAIDSGDTTKFDNIIDKYAIDYVVYDPHSSDTNTRRVSLTKKMLINSNIMSLYKKWDTFAIYESERPINTKVYSTFTTLLPNIGPSESEKATAHSYGDVGYYMSDDTRPYDKYFPFIDLTANATIEDKKLHLEDDGKYLYFTSKLNAYASSYTLSKTKSTDQVLFSNGDKITVDEDLVRTIIHKDALLAYFSKQTISKPSLSKITVKNCGWKHGTVTWAHDHGALSIQAKQAAVGCASYNTPVLKGKQHYIMQLESDNNEGAPLHLEIQNAVTHASLLQTSLDAKLKYIALNPGAAENVQYRLNFRGESDQNFNSDNVLRAITIYAFPFDEVKSIVLANKQTSAIAQAHTLLPQEAQEYGSYEYIYTAPQSGKTLTDITFMQPYDSKWTVYVIPASYNHTIWASIAPYAVGRLQKNHLLVNSWANGWTIAPLAQGTVVVVMNWPRYTAVVGGLILAIMIAIYSIIESLKYLPKKK